MNVDDIRALVSQAAAAYRKVHPWVNEEMSDRWWNVAFTWDEAGETITGWGVVYQNMPPDDFSTFMKAWMRARTG